MILAAVRTLTILMAQEIWLYAGEGRDYLNTVNYGEAERSSLDKLA